MCCDPSSTNLYLINIYIYCRRVSDPRVWEMCGTLLKWKVLFDPVITFSKNKKIKEKKIRENSPQIACGVCVHTCDFIYNIPVTRKESFCYCVQCVYMYVCVLLRATLLFFFISLFFLHVAIVLYMWLQTKSITQWICFLVINSDQTFLLLFLHYFICVTGSLYSILVGWIIWNSFFFSSYWRR